MSYQSPIELDKKDAIFINKMDQNITIKGENRGAIYDPVKFVFNVVDNIILQINSKTYKLIEYHFHSPSEHYLKSA